MGKLRKIGKKIGRGFKSIGKKFKKAFGKVAKAFGKLGPLGSIALSFMLPGVGSWISGLPEGNFIKVIADGIGKAGNFIKDGVGKVFNRVTDAIEYGMNKVSGIVPGGKGELGTNFRNWVSETTGGFIDPSTKGVDPITVPGETRVLQSPQGPIKVEVPETTISPEAQMGIGGPKVPQTPKGMTDPVYVDGLDTDLRKGFYEQADLDTYYTGIDTPVNIGAGTSTNVAGSNIGIDGPPKPIKAVDRATIKTSDGMSKPKIEGKSYFGRAKDVYKKVAPIQVIGSEIQAGEDAEKMAKLEEKKATAQYFSNVAQETLMKSADPTTNYIDFNDPNPSSEDQYAVENSYGLILGVA